MSDKTTYQTEYSASIFLTFAGSPLVLSGKLSDTETIFKVKMPDFTLGGLINGIIHMVKPGYDLQFDSPWSEILAANIGGFNLMAKVPADKEKPIEFGFEYEEEIKISSLFTITKLSVFARSIRDINFNMAGSLSFLGIDYDLAKLFGEDGVNLLDPQGMPKPEPGDTSIFKLNFLGVGQHLELQNATDYNHINQVVDKLEELMKPPAPGTVVPVFSEVLKFNNSSQWLFAIDAVVMETVSFKIAFNDPALYGLFLSLHGKKAKVFEGLDFEILYKKITDDLGVYQIELKLPDAIRNIELGAVSITLPIIGIWIYTNGNFKVDLGFPYNNDFSRSFTVQAFPFTGSGGFYFAVLNGSTSLSLPATKLGTFSPVLEFGIGMNLGLGKTFNKGILSAGLTIVFYGIVEGTLAWFKPLPPSQDLPGTDFYYKLKGTFGIVGHIYGSVNFAIISATLDIMVYAQATITIEAAEPILLAFEAGVSIELTVKISLGFFSIRIHLSFSATVREQFTIGSPAAAQWKVSQGNLMYQLAEQPSEIDLNWGNLVTLVTPQRTDLYFIPFFSATKVTDKQETVGIASLFAENNNNKPKEGYDISGNSLNTDSPLTSFDKVCVSILAWTFNASNGQSQTSSFADLLTDTITPQQIELIGNTLAQNNKLFTYPELINFIKQLFVLNIIEVPNRNEEVAQNETTELPLTVFPIIPDLFLTADSNATVIDFSTFNSVNAEYIRKVLDLVSQFTDNDPAALKATADALTESIATLLFRDYFQLVVKSLIQSVQDNFEAVGNGEAKTIQAILNELYQNNSFNKAGGSASRFALHGLQLPDVTEEGKPGKLMEGLYELSGQQIKMPVIEDPKTFNYNITLSKTNPVAIEDENPAAIDWLTFNGQDVAVGKLVYDLSTSEIERVYAFQTVDLKPVIADKDPKPLKLYKDQNRVFTFSNPIIWDDFEKEKPTIWTFPSSLIGIGNSRPTIVLNVAKQANAAADREVKTLLDDKYFYGTLLPITIKKVSNQVKEKINESTFEVFGTDASGIELLTSLLRTANVNDVLDTITILYATESATGDIKALKSDDLSKLLLLLINTNLSTETNPENLRMGVSKQISNTAPIDFISRVWKSSLVRTGGYYLYYDLDGKTLPETLFDKNGNGEIYLLIKYKSPEVKVVAPYMNMARIVEPIDNSQLLFGEWRTIDLNKANAQQLNELLVRNQLVRSAIIKPGNIGFELTRINPDNLPSLPKESYDLEVQYNLLNYEVVAQGDFKGLKSVAPVGPTNPLNDTDKNWFYSKAMPIRKFYNGDTSSAYVGLNKEVSIDFKWQDNYGNNFNSPINGVKNKILYFDQLVPFSAWPSLTIDYYLYAPNQAKPDDNFALTYHFIPGQNYSFNPNGSDVEKIKTALVNQARESLKIYEDILDQISQDDVTINFNVSLNPTALYPLAIDKGLKSEIKKFVAKNIEWINLFIAKPDDNNQQEGIPDRKEFINVYSYSCKVDPIAPLDIFALSVNVIISRSPELIDPQFIYQDNGRQMYVPGVQQVTNAVKPKVAGFPNVEVNDDDKLLGLKQFTQHFEEAFGTQQFKLAATYIGEKTNSLVSNNSNELWAVRIKINEGEKGIACTVNYDQANFYAPQPHANFLFSLPDVPINSFDYYKGNKSATTIKSFSEIDSEAWAINFLQGVETVLGSDLSLPITMVDHLNNTPDNAGILAGLLKAKETVAGAIALQTIPILINQDQSKAGLDLAAEKLKQQLLINLYNGYLINAVVQYRVNLESPYPSDDQSIAPNYYGKPFIYAESNAIEPKSGLQQNYSFSTAKIPLKNFGQEGEKGKESYLTYTFESKTPSLASHLKLPVHYNITHAEFNIQKLRASGSRLPEDLNNYEVSQWLNFIIPFEAATNNVVDTNIPIPLRQYPSLPVFGSQLFDPKVKDVTEAVTIEDAKSSSFSFDYTLGSFVSQDSYNFEVYFNADPADHTNLHNSKGLSDKQKRLFEQLAQFTAVDNEFKDYFGTKLPAVGKDISDNELDEITKVLNGYSGLVNGVSKAWLDLYTKDHSLKSNATLEVIIAKFDVKEGAADTEDPNPLFELKVSNWEVSTQGKAINYVHFPEIKVGDWLPELQVSNRASLPGELIPVTIRYYQGEGVKKKYLTMDDAKDITTRSIKFKDLSVLLIQNAWAGLWIERNAELSKNYKTAPEFIYATPMNRFNNPIMPSLNVSNTFELQPPAPDQNSLMDYIKNLLAKLLLKPGGGTAPASLKILIQYRFTPGSGTGEMPSVILPIALMPPTLFTDEDVAGVGPAAIGLNTVILDWFEVMQPNLNKGFITFSAFFYSNLTGATNSLPLLILDNLEIDVNKVRIENP